MNRRQALTGAAVLAAIPLTAQAGKLPCPGPSADMLQAAGALWLFAQGDLNQALAALVQVSAPGCSL